MEVYEGVGEVTLGIELVWYDNVADLIGILLVLLVGLAMADCFACVIVVVIPGSTVVCCGLFDSLTKTCCSFCNGCCS